MFGISDKGFTVLFDFYRTGIELIKIRFFFAINSILEKIFGNPVLMENSVSASSSNKLFQSSKTCRYIYAMKTAIILGATGLTGGLLLEKLLIDPYFQKIKLFSRSSSEMDSTKIEEHLIDLFQLEKHSEAFKADVVFCCIGTTKAKTPDKETYRKIDHGIPASAAKLAKANGIKTFIVVSAIGANENSSIFYNKTKGEMERDVLNQNIENTFILQPSLIVGNRKESRFGEIMAEGFMKVFGFLVPKKYKMIKAETIAEAMRILAKEGYANKMITSEKIQEIANQ